MSSESILCVSYFDNIIGPNTFYCNETLDVNEHPDVGRILEFQDREGPFLFAYRKYQTVNYIFYVDSELARGGKDILMITYMIRAGYFKDEISDLYRFLESKMPELEDFAGELKKLNDLSKIIHSNKDRKSKENLLNIASAKFRKSFFRIYDKYYKKITPQIPITSPSFISKGGLKKVYIFGPEKSGKTTLLKNLEVFQFLQYKNEEKKRDLVSKIYDFLIDNIEILTYECIEEEENKDLLNLYEGCIDNAQGFILVYDASKKESAKDTIEMFQIVLNRCLDKDETMPILMIGNKFNGKEVLGPNFISKNFDFDELSECGMIAKHFSINVRDDDDALINSVRWLLKEII